MRPLFFNPSLKNWYWRFFFTVQDIKTIVFIFIVTLTTFRPKYPSTFFRGFMSNENEDNEDEDNSPNILSDKNYQTSSLKLRQKILDE